jgi:hypothetical protein
VNTWNSHNHVPQRLLHSISPISSITAKAIHEELEKKVKKKEGKRRNF